MGKRSKELRKRKREQERRNNVVQSTSTNNVINCQPLIEVLDYVKPPQVSDSQFYHVLLTPFRKALWPLLDTIANAYEEKNPTTKKQRKHQMKKYNERNNDFDINNLLTNTSDIFVNLPLPNAINIIFELKKLSYEDMSHSGYKPFRTCIHPFVVERLSEKYSSISSQITSAFRDEREKDALRLLTEMRRRDDTPKLGTLQRWVRDCMNLNDFAGLNSKRSVELLDAIVRLQPVEWEWKKNNNQDNDHDRMDNHDGELNTVGEIRWSQSFFRYPKRNITAVDPHEIKYLTVTDAPNNFLSDKNDANYYHGVYGTRTREINCKNYMKNKNILLNNTENSDYSIVYHEEGKDRRPINNFDLNIYTINENKLLKFDNDSSNSIARKRFDVTSVPGAFLISDVLSGEECENIIQMAESSPQGYVPDEPTTSAKPPEGFAPRAANLVLLSEKITSILYNRTKQFLPTKLGNGSNELAGLNSRLRFYRYQPGAIYRPHVDGSWPGSGIHNGKYYYDYYGDRWSRLTFLVYLNDDFDGGGTSFYVPSKDVGNLQAFTVEPRQGSVLVFPHGGVAGSLVHEGSFCKVGVKYIIRTDVLYKIPGHTRKTFTEQ